MDPTISVTMGMLDQLDFDVIKDLPWAQELWTQIQNHTKKGFLNWCRIVKKLVGTKPEPVKDWSEEYLKSIDETFCYLVMELDNLHSKTIDNIQMSLGKLENLCVQLHLKVPSHIGEKELSLFEEHLQLNRKIQEYEGIINARTKEIDALNEKQNYYCKCLGKQPKFTLQCPPLPTPAQLEDFQKHIDELEHEKFEREESYCKLKEDILKFVDELNYKPNRDFERDLLSSNEFLVTSENMQKLKLFHLDLKHLKTSTEEEIFRLRSKVEDLWKMLEVDLIDRDEFRSHYVGNKLDNLEALRTEIKRCEEIRKTNIKLFVEKMRNELNSWWEKCHCTDEERRKFQYFYSDCYTVDLLDLHEMEIQRWSEYYRENLKLFSLLEKHQELWKESLELEENSTGTNRYKNRGGKLLQEEKERNKLSKLIPKIEEEIYALSEEYKINNNGKSFMICGQSPEEYIGQMHAEKENTRKLKLSARKLQRDLTPGRTPSKSAISLFPASTSSALTPKTLSVVKRKILGTPNTGNKKQKLQTPNKPEGPLPKIKITHATMTLPSQKRRSRSSMERRKKHSHKKHKDLELVANTTYTTFQNELSSRSEARSTIIPDQIQVKTPGSSKMLKKTLSKTPALRTPLTRSPNPRNGKQLSACKTNLKLLF